MKYTRIVLISIMAGLSGCATLSEDECRSADWYRIGVDDGRNGKPGSLLEEHREACIEYGIRPDDGLYFEGRRRGLDDYCRIDNAFQSGLDGRRYQGVCPPEIDARFRRANKAAYAVYESRREIDQVDRQLADKEEALLDKELDKEERRELRREIHNLDRRRARLRDDLFQAERDLDRLMHLPEYRR